jgi:hypothetical protein
MSHEVLPAKGLNEPSSSLKIRHQASGKLVHPPDSVKISFSGGTKPVTWVMVDEIVRGSLAEICFLRDESKKWIQFAT